MPKRPARVIIDTDGGIDDALALILALQSPEIELVGVTSVSGNVRVEQATINSLQALELLDRPEVWVAQGQGNPLLREPVRATSFHGTDGLGDSNLPQPKLRARQDSAQALLSQQLHAEKNHSLTIACIGPLTNIAVLLNQDPDATKNVREVLMMGGAFGLTQYGTGNVTPAAEFNIYSDPEAASMVFDSGLPLRAVGLDVTQSPQTWLTPVDYARVKSSKGRLAAFATRILANTMQQRKLFELHDPIALGAAIQPSLYDFKSYPVKVETKGEHTTGMTVTDRREDGENAWTTSNVSICTKLKAQRFKRLFFSHLLKD